MIFNNLTNKIERQKEKIRNIVKYLFKYLIYYRPSIVKIKDVDDNIKNVDDNIKNIDNNIKNIDDNIKNIDDNIENVKIEMKKITNEIVINRFLSKKVIVKNEKKKEKGKKIDIKKTLSGSFKNIKNNIKNIMN